MVNKKNLTDHVTADKMIGNCKEHIPNQVLHFSYKEEFSRCRQNNHHSMKIGQNTYDNEEKIALGLHNFNLCSCRCYFQKPKGYITGIYVYIVTCPQRLTLMDWGNIRPLGVEVTFHSEYAYKNNYRIKNIF